MKLAALKKEIAHFFNSALHLHAGDYREVKIINPDGITNNLTRVQYANQELLIRPKAMKDFVHVLQTLALEDMQKMTQRILSTRDNTIRLHPIMPVEMIDIGDTTKEDPYFNGAMGCNFIEIDKRFDGLFNSVKADFELIARYMTHGAAEYRKDDTKAKTSDLYFFFNTVGTGEEIDFFLSPTNVPGVGVSPDIEPNKKPISEYEMETYFGYPSSNASKAEMKITVKDEIEAAIERINDRIKEIYDINEAKAYPVCKDMIDDKLNKILIPVVVTMRLAPYSTFGDNLTAIDLAEGKSANAIEVGDIIDGEITKLVDHLKAIPIEEGSKVVRWAMDVDSFGIYGRDENNELVETMVDPKYMFATVFQPGYSDGFTRHFANYIKTIKNDFFFSTNGTSVERLKTEDENELRTKAANELLGAWKTSGLPEIVKVSVMKRLEKEGVDVSEINPDLTTENPTLAEMIDIKLREMAFNAAGAKDIPAEEAVAE